MADIEKLFKQFREWLCTPEEEGGKGLTEKSASSYISDLKHLESQYLVKIGLSIMEYVEALYTQDSESDVTEESVEGIINSLISSTTIDGKELKRLQNTRSALRALVFFIHSHKTENTYYFNDLMRVFKERLKTQHRKNSVQMRDITSNTSRKDYTSVRYNRILVDALLNAIILTEHGPVLLKHIDWLQITNTSVYVFVRSIQKKLKVMTYDYSQSTPNLMPLVVKDISQISLDHTPGIAEVVKMYPGKFKVFGTKTTITPANIDSALDDLERLTKLTTITLMHITHNLKKQTQRKSKSKAPKA